MKKATPLVVLLTSLLTIFLSMKGSNDFEIKGPESAVVGELVILEAEEASSYEWRILPSTTNYELIESGKKLIFAAKENGEYLFICAATVEGKTKLLLKRVIVGNKVVNLITTVRSWLPENYNKEEAERLAISFENVADSSKAEDIANFIAVTALSNRTALGNSVSKWQSFLEQLSAFCEENYQDKSLQEHVLLWKEVAKALRGEVS